VSALGGEVEGQLVASDAAPETPRQFADWVRPHLPAMTRVAARLTTPSDADDVVQEALARAWTRRVTFRPERGTASAWLLAITADRARRTHRRRGPVLVDEPADDQPIEAGRDPGEDIDLERAIARLSPRQRLVIDCVYFADLSIADAAAVMDCSPGTVKSTLSDARARLRILLEET
jgi:RNA polymerase sigma-70 factor (ECF subfamily)